LFGTEQIQPHEKLRSKPTGFQDLGRLLGTLQCSPDMAANVDMKLLKQTKFPPEFNQKVDMKKVNIEVMKKYFSSILHSR
jgi:membrane-bound lytic murein transglycosylase MltF